jgi:hypothetical protein
MIQQFHFWLYSPKEFKTGTQTDVCEPTSQQNYSQQPKEGNNPTYGEILFSFKKERYSDNATAWINLEGFTIDEISQSIGTV